MGLQQIDLPTASQIGAWSNLNIHPLTGKLTPISLCITYKSLHSSSSPCPSFCFTTCSITCQWNLFSFLFPSLSQTNPLFTSSSLMDIIRDLEHKDHLKLPLPPLPPWYAKLQANLTGSVHMHGAGMLGGWEFLWAQLQNRRKKSTFVHFCHHVLWHREERILLIIYSPFGRIRGFVLCAFDALVNYRNLLTEFVQMCFSITQFRLLKK